MESKRIGLFSKHGTAGSGGEDKYATRNSNKYKYKNTTKNSNKYKYKFATQTNTNKQIKN